jgi:hypothetical protein
LNILLVFNCFTIIYGIFKNIELKDCNNFRFFIENLGIFYLNWVRTVYGFWFAKDISRWIFLNKAIIKNGASSA